MSASKPYDLIILGAGIAGLYAAMRATARGMRVAVVDRGPADPRAQRPARPGMSFLERANEGTLEARNHVLGGNSGFWGGALIRQRDGELAAMLGFAEARDEEKIVGNYEEVERFLKLPVGPWRWDMEAGGQTLRMCRVVVLPGRKRNLGRLFVGKTLRSKLVDLYPSFEPCSLDRGGDGYLKAIHIRDDRDRVKVLQAKSFILSMGVIDSVLFGLRYGKQLGAPAVPFIGRNLHDHLSVPLFEIHPSEGYRFQRDLLPTVSGPYMLGRRVELQGDGLPLAPSGFLHFQCFFDEAEPYASLKKLMELRQRGFGLRTGLRALVGCTKASRLMLKIAARRIRAGELYISPDVRIVAMLDFESSFSAQNSLAIGADDGCEGCAVLSWDVRQEDVAAFNGLYGKVQAVLAALARDYGFQYSPMKELEEAVSPGVYFKQHARDAYHLGGGLRAGRSPDDSLCDEELRWHGISNLYVVSTAVFRRPGSANPVLTLLALADRVVARL